MPFYTSLKDFDTLTNRELYEIMALRQEVFVVEQNCPYLDADGVDTNAHHLMIRNKNEQLVAYTRLIPPHVSYENYSSIGRVVTSPSVRGTGIGKLLMTESLAMMKTLFGTEHNIKIGAQSYLLQFYTSLGFVSTGEDYIEDNIPHTKMIFHY
jgi:ElaA protein